MQQGNVYYAIENGLCVFRLEGDISYTSVVGWGRFAEKILEDSGICTVLVDLTKVRYIDSSNLGELAKIAVIVRSRMGTIPCILSTNPDIDSVISCMGLNVVFSVLHETDECLTRELTAIPASELGLHEQTRRILDAHRQLSGLNEHNRALFADVVKDLDRELGND